MDSYRTISSCGNNKITRKRSRFLSFVYPVNNTNETNKILEELRVKYHDASHCCYAYQLLEDSTITSQSSDAGEPPNSAGKPILQQIEEFNLVNVLVAVVRYFGGKKLGVGGLIRAYSDATRVALEQAPVVTRQIRKKLELCFAPELNSGVMSLIHRHPASITDITYTDNARIRITLPPSRLSSFVEKLRDVTGAQAHWKEIN